MTDKVLLVHGWSVTETMTYQAMHLKLKEHGYELNEIYLGRYASLDNEVEMRLCGTSRCPVPTSACWT